MDNSQRWYYWISFFVFIALLYLLSPILTPFVLGALIAYLGDPSVSWLEQHRVPRTLGVTFVFIVILLIVFLLVFLLFPILEKQTILFIEKIPQMVDWVQQTVVPWVNKRFDVGDGSSLLNLKEQLGLNVAKAGNIVNTIVQTATHSGLALIEFVTNLILVPVVAFYLMRDWQKVLSSMMAIVPKHLEKQAVNLAVECNEVVGAFFKGQLLVMIALGIIYSTGLWLVGVEVALIVGLISGLVAIVPYLGFIVGIVVASIVSFLEYHTFGHVVLVWLVYGVGQCLESMVLTPLLVGDRIGLHPVAVIFAVLAGGVLFGFMGVLLALPVAAVIMVFLRHLHEYFFETETVNDATHT